MSFKVVVVDDEPDIREILHISLRIRDYDVVTANDGEEGLALIRKVMPDLAILDVKMPKMNGYEVLNALRRDEKLCDLPVIVLTSLTANSGVPDETWRERLQVTGFLSKPFDTSQLLDTIDTLLRGQPDHQG